jgi:hypothetical protein
VKSGTEIHGLLAEFATPEALVVAAGQTWEEGYRRLDAFSPYPIEELEEALHLERSRLPRFVLGGGIAGAIFGYALEYWTTVVAYPLNVGGRPLHSWPSFIVPAFETTILCAALGAVGGLLWLSRLPEPYHPLFNVEAFAGATSNRFFLSIEASDPRYDATRTRRLLEGLGAKAVTEVPR